MIAETGEGPVDPPDLLLGSRSALRLWAPRVATGLLIAAAVGAFLFAVLVLLFDAFVTS